MIQQETSTKKHALVTGGSRGIGRAICLKLATMGYDVIVNYASREEEARTTLNLVREAGSDGEIMRFDVNDQQQVTNCLTDWAARHQGEYIEVLVNNAGINRDQPLVFMPRDDWQQVVDTTLGGFYNVTQAVLQPMLVHRNGRIVNISSISGVKGQPGQTNYSAAKGGLIAATKALALEVARRNITVNAVAPGFIHTDMTSGLDEKSLSKTIPAGRFGEPEEVAAAVAFLVSGEAAYITGNVINVNGGLHT